MKKDVDSSKLTPDATDHATEMTAENRSSQDLIRIFYGLALVSGAAALIYEVAWARMLALTFGSTTLSVAAVVAGFMGGMGVGAFSYQLLLRRYKRPLIIYGMLELGIAGAAALLTLFIYRLPALSVALSDALPPGPVEQFGRFAVVFVLLLPPSALMGATFPALCAVLIHSAREVDRHLGMIYGLNTIGAAAGVFIVGFVLIERLGLQASTYVANAMNLSVGVVALVVAVRRKGENAILTKATTVATAIPTTMPRWLTGIVLLVSGFTTLSYEILWFRGLHYFVGNATYAISTVLIIFLVGLGLGSLLLKRTVQRGAPERDLALIQLAIAVLAVSAMACDWFLISQQVVRENITIFAEGMFARPWWWRLFFGAVIAVVTLLPATLMMGLSFPLASRLFLGDVKKLDSRVGTAYLLANIGSIAGASLAAIILLPQFGTVGGTKLIAAINLLLGLALMRWIPAGEKDMARPVVLAILITVLLVGVMPASLPLRGEWLTADEPGKVISVEEGDLATVQVLEHPKNPNMLAMSIDGFKIGWSEGFRGTQVHEKQVLLAHLPMVIDPRIRHTLNVGLGSGGTLDTLATYSEIETLDCVEINAPVLRGCQLFPESRVLDDPRVTVTIDDAVHYLMRTEKQFDLIISDGKQHPFYSGNATLLCREYYELASDRLSDNGMFVQWVPMSMLNDDFKINMRTMCDVFPHVEVFFFPKWAIYVVASHRPLQGRPTMSQQEYDTLAVRRDMKLYMIDQPIGLLSHWAAGKDQLQQVLGDGPQCTWDHMRLDFSAYKADVIQWAFAKASNLDLLIAASEIKATTGQGPGNIRETAFGRSSDQVRRSFAAFYGGDLSSARRHATEAVSINPDDRTAELTRRFMLSRKQAEGLPPGR